MKKKNRYELRIPNGKPAPRLCPELAKEIGLNESILLLQLDYLISISTTPMKKERYWTFQSIRKLAEEYFPFWGKSTINRAINNTNGIIGQGRR